jgi:hypothetical protein
MNVTTATPVEIDTVLASLYRAESSLLHKVDVESQYLRDKAGIRLASDEVSRYDREPKTVGTTADALAILKAKVAADTSTYAYSDGAYAKQRVDAYEAAVAALEANRAAQAPLHAEFDRRGGWTRSFMVLNSNGHAHRDMHCSTCRWNTRYGWLVALSGSTEAEVIEAIGSDACTVCYPDAPVVKRARTVFAPEEIEEQAARAARQAEKDAKAAAKAAKAAADDLRVTVTLTAKDSGYDYRGGISTIRKAKSFLTDGEQWGWDHPYYNATDRDAVAAALAARNETTVEAEIAAAAKRAARR